ncbi:hypothetical protein Mmc1_1375 [Magnetococcus marinus MC-1]|uniref:Uncharacterized protein n=1 Tax=Magnetococcus marinus (strain ATCC BAA-1437 / JCM 17883 / MC-1) TaxID=156889 RepID=A0L7E3_MAGMM|nr:hypothetical protein [Magnetococcus marinus]ABK43886.1 hypothetical protein Mmc1_1375 [Magnetococcus marinus MC-1]
MEIFIFFLIIILLFDAVIGFLIGKDAGRRGMSSIGWGLFVFFTSIFGIIIYIAVQQPRLTPEELSAIKQEKAEKEPASKGLSVKAHAAVEKAYAMAPSINKEKVDDGIWKSVNFFVGIVDFLSVLLAPLPNVMLAKKGRLAYVWLVIYLFLVAIPIYQASTDKHYDGPSETDFLIGFIGFAIIITVIRLAINGILKLTARKITAQNVDNTERS